MMKRGLFLLLLLPLLGIANTALADDISVGDVSNTGCGNRTRTEGNASHAILKLTRTESGLVGELRSYRVHCGVDAVNVTCEEDGQSLTINIAEDLGEHWADCTCPVTIYFTIFNALKDEYQLTVHGRNVRELGMISFKEHSMVEIDMVTLVKVYDEDFEYPLMVQNFAPYIYNYELDPSFDTTQRLGIENNGTTVFSFLYKYYVVPLEYNYLDVTATFNQDSTLVVNVLTDGIPEKDGKRISDLGFNIVNLLKETYHLQLNQTILYGTEDEYTACLYEGDIIVPRGRRIEIPLGCNQNFVPTMLPQILDNDAEAPYYDLQGRRINGKPEKGIYIQNGKKIKK